MNNESDFLAEMFAGREPINLDPKETTDPSNIDFKSSDTPPQEDEEQEEFTPPDDAEDSLESDDITVSYVDFLKQNDLVVIPEDLQFSGKPEELEKIFEHTKTTRQAEAVDKIFNALPEDFKPLFDYALAGGTSLNDFMSVYAKDPLSNIDLTKVEDQRKIVAEHYRATTEYSDEKINRLVSLITDEDDLKLEAEDAYKELGIIREKEKTALIEQTAAQREADRQRVEAQTLALSKAVDTTTSIHAQRKHKVKSFFFDPVNIGGSTTTGFNHAVQSILANPEHQAQLADILLEYDATAGFSGERFERKFRTKATGSFQEALEKALNPKQAQRASTQKTPNSSNFDWETYSKH
jgi:hypothetical protein